MFGVPMVWREPKNILMTYFCLVSITGINKKNHNKWTYPDLPSARRPISHSDEVPISTFHQLPMVSDDEVHRSDTLDDEGDTSDCDYEEASSNPQRFNQNELSLRMRSQYFKKSC